MVTSIIRKTKDYIKELVKLFYIFPSYKKHLNEYKKCNKRKIVLIGTPAHGNLGDHAIAVSELEFIENYKKDETIFEIPTPLYKTHRNYLKKYINSGDLIIISGGGWMGNLWIHNEVMIRNITEDYPDNKIVIFPQTLYYTDDKEGQETARNTRVCFENHNKIYLAVRDNNSYLAAQKLLGFTENSGKLLFCPDMVLYGNLAKENRNATDSKTALICLRQDVEKISEITGIETVVGSCGYVPQKTTTVYSSLIKMSERKKVLNALICHYAEADLMITDRLHAMIFSLLAGIPCYVFNNVTGKVFGVAAYLQKCGMPIKMLNNADEISYDTFNLEGKVYELDGELENYFRNLGRLLND